MQTIMRIIKSILTRLKMLVFRTVLNTDYDTQKEQAVVPIAVETDSFTLAASGTGAVKNWDVLSDVTYDTTYELISTTSTYFPDVVLSGDNPVYDDGKVNYQFFVLKEQGNKYRIRIRLVNYSRQQITMPAGVMTVKIHQFVPSSQD